MRRHFEFQEGTSSKFWEIENEGSSVTTCWGRIGAAGQSKTKDFGTGAKAQSEYNKLIAEKTAKGYVEVDCTGNTVPVAAETTKGDGDSIWDLWKQIEDWLAHNAPKIIDNLNPGASEEQIAAIEHLIGKRMSQEWRDLYRIHNGMNHEGNMGNLFYCYEFLSLERVQSELEMQQGQACVEPVKVRVADAEIRTKNLYNQLWIPLAHDRGDTLLRIDLDPGKGGAKGQIICTDYGCDAVILLAPSIIDLLRQFVEDLNRGYYFLADQADDNHFLKCNPEIDVVNWSFSPRWQHLKV